MSGSLVLAGVAGWLVVGQSQELSGASAYLSHLRWWWVVAAVAAEIGSYVSFSAAQRVLLRVGDLDVAMSGLLGVTVVSTSMQNSLPAGVAFSAAFVFRRYRRFGADEVLAGWAVLVLTGLSFVTLAALAASGLALAFGTGSALDLVQVILGILAVAAALVAAWAGRGWLFERVIRLVEPVGKRLGRPVGETGEAIRRFRVRLGSISPSRRVWLQAGVLAGGNWLLDLSCLAAAYLAVDPGVPWRGLLLAYAAAQLAANLPITPGGLGVVEGSLTVALVAFGGGASVAVAAVVVYRVISYWAELPIGWLTWGAMRVRARGERLA